MLFNNDILLKTKRGVKFSQSILNNFENRAENVKRSILLNTPTACRNMWDTKRG